MGVIRFESQTIDLVGRFALTDGMHLSGSRHRKQRGRRFFVSLCCPSLRRAFRRSRPGMKKLPMRANRQRG